MTENRDLDPFTAELLLSGAPVDGEVGPLADLLAAAAADARADELTGEAAALVAFRDAAGVQPGAGSVGHRSAGRFLGLKVAIAVAAVAGAGVAGAAAAGLVGGGDDGSPTAVSTPSVTSSVKSEAQTPSHPETTVPDEHAGGNESPDPTTRTPSPTKTRTTPRSTPSSPKPSVTSTPTRPVRPSAQVLSMCRAYLMFSRYGSTYRSRYYSWPSRSRDDRSRADWMLDQPYFQPMVKAAGGKSKVPAYCKRVVTENSTPGNRAPQIAAPPSPSARPSGRPTNDPTSRPTASQTGTATTALPPPRGR